jgi:hypothetical protein
MTVATFSQPNFTTDTDASAYKAKLDAAAAVHNNIAGQFAPHEAAAPNMTVVVDAGRLMYNGGLVIQAQQISGAITAPVGNPRIDRVVIDEITGAISVITGTPAASPAAPAVTAGKLPCCQVLLQTSSTVITNSMITDERTTNNKSSVTFSEFVPVVPGTTADISNTATTTVNWTTANLSVLNGTGATAVMVRLYLAHIGSAGVAATQRILLAQSGQSGAPPASNEAGRQYECLPLGGVMEGVNDWIYNAAQAVIPLDSNQDFQYAISRGGTISSCYMELRVVGYWRPVTL